MSRHLGKGRISDDIRKRMRARERELVLEDIDSLDEVEAERIDEVMRRIKLPGSASWEFKDAVKRLHHNQAAHGQARIPSFSWSTNTNTLSVTRNPSV